jgi:hypothetical protein
MRDVFQMNTQELIYTVYLWTIVKQALEENIIAPPFWKRFQFQFII